MIDQLKEHLKRTPFEPFRITTTGGERFDVRDRYAVAIAESHVFYCFPRSDKSTRIRINQIVALESLPAAA